jgi:hypothetical protein
MQTFVKSNYGVEATEMTRPRVGQRAKLSSSAPRKGGSRTKLPGFPKTQ